MPVCRRSFVAIGTMHIYEPRLVLNPDSEDVRVAVHSLKWTMFGDRWSVVYAMTARFEQDFPNKRISSEVIIFLNQPAGKPIEDFIGHWKIGEYIRIEIDRLERPRRGARSYRAERIGDDTGHQE